MWFYVFCMMLLLENGYKEINVILRICWRKKIFGYIKYKEDDDFMELKDVWSIFLWKKRNIFWSKCSDYCFDLRFNLYDDECLGMCGFGCLCWFFVCGNCCYNKLCFEYDKCCWYNKYLLSCWLLFVYSLSCKEGFGGYLGCLN